MRDIIAYTLCKLHGRAKIFHTMIPCDIIFHKYYLLHVICDLHTSEWSVPSMSARLSFSKHVQ